MLLQALTRDQLIFPLFVLIAQQRNAILFKSSSSSSSSSASSQVQQLSLLAEAYDRCQDALTQVCRRVWQRRLGSNRTKP